MQRHARFCSPFGYKYNVSQLLVSCGLGTKLVLLSKSNNWAYILQMGGWGRLGTGSTENVLY